MFAYYVKYVNIEDVIEREYAVSDISDLLETMFLSGSKNKSFNDIVKTAMLSHNSSDVFTDGIKAVSNTVDPISSDCWFLEEVRKHNS